MLSAAKQLREANKDVMPSEFRWAVGFEGSFIPHLNIDQYEWTQHNQHWREDMALVANDLGCRWVRYPLAWHLIESAPGQFDWSWADERIEQANKLGLNLIIDLVHFGTPTWLPDAFADIDLPAALERYARAFGERYNGQVRYVCPLNEPSTIAFFSGEMGLWPPHGRSLQCYTTVMARSAQAMSRAITALRETMPNVEILACEPLDHAYTDDDADETTSSFLAESLRADVQRRNLRRHLALDLITGRIDAAHDLRNWLLQHGFSPVDLNWFLKHPVEFDVLGLDYYPHTEVELYTSPDGHYRQRVPQQPVGLCRAAQAYWQRFGKPIIIGETSVTGSEEDRGCWLDYTLFEVRRLREEGIPVIGYTWWPVIDHLDWDGALLHRTGHIHPVGIYRLERASGGKLRRVATSLRDAYRELIKRGDEPVGAIAPNYDVPSTINVVPRREQERKIMPQTNLSYPIIVHSHLCWGWVWQRPQQFLSRLSKRHRVLFVEGPSVVEEEFAPCYQLHPAPGFPNVTIMQTQFPAGRFEDGAYVDSERLRMLREVVSGPLAHKFDNPVQWFYDPMAVTAHAGSMNEIAVVYDCMDQLSQFKFAPPELVVRELELLQSADVVFAGGRKLWESKSRHNANCHFYGCGVDVAHFGTARSAETEIPFDIDFVPRPILGFFGVVDERLDYELIRRMADEKPEWSIAMVGPVCKVDPNSLPRGRNIYWLGGRDYESLPAYAKSFDLCLMPFALNEATEYINPTKALEYMATGTPIVSTAVPDVVSNFSQVVSIARSHEKFIEACAASLEQPDQVAIERGLKMAEANTWDAIVAKLEKHISDALNRKTSIEETEVERTAVSAA